MAEPAKNIAKKETTAVVALSEADLIADAALGAENITKDDLAVPFLRILQSGSPECKRADGKYIPGAEEGMILNTVSRELFFGDEGVEIIPCYFLRNKMEWTLREDGGGLVAVHPADAQISTTADDKGRQITEAGTQIVDTANHYVLVLSPNGSIDRAIVSMSSTQLKKSRTWNSYIQNLTLKLDTGKIIQMPRFSQVYTLTTVPESNDKGSWYGWQWTHTGPVTDTGTYQTAKDFALQIREGVVHAATDEE